jgi:catechol 2,3-dioxygenase-like lactoylglutathione lyase family enzyme
MKFGYTILYVDDVAATLDFYRRAFGFDGRMVDPAGNYGELDTGETRLAFAGRDFVRTLMPVELAPGGRGNAAAPMEIGFTTSQVEQAYERALEAGAVEVKRPATKPWGQVVGYVRDLNGFLVEICSPIS